MRSRATAGPRGYARDAKSSREEKRGERESPYYGTESLVRDATTRAQRYRHGAERSTGARRLNARPVGAPACARPPARDYDSRLHRRARRLAAGSGRRGARARSRARAASVDQFAPYAYLLPTAAAAVSSLPHRSIPSDHPRRPEQVLRASTARHSVRTRPTALVAVEYFSRLSNRSYVDLAERGIARRFPLGRPSVAGGDPRRFRRIDSYVDDCSLKARVETL